MVETADQEDRQGRELYAVFSGGEVCGERHFADVEGKPADHATESLNKDGHLLEVEREAFRDDRTVLDTAVIPLGSAEGGKRDGHIASDEV
ncbi:hypothetical protein GCM10009589_28020 [Arthrobacter pascens]